MHGNALQKVNRQVIDGVCGGLAEYFGLIQSLSGLSLSCLYF